MPIPGLATAFGEKVWRLGNRAPSGAVVEARSQRISPDVGPLSTTLAALPLPWTFGPKWLSAAFTEVRLASTMTIPSHASPVACKG